MDVKIKLWLLLLVMQSSLPCHGFEPVSGFVAGLAGIGSFIYTGYTAMKCRFIVCCDDKMISLNTTGLTIDLSEKLHGQHLVRKAVMGHIMAHLQSNNPSKALALSFHGVTGVGKNFVSRILADNIYKNGLRSPFVHLISATKEFPHEGMVPFYKEQLKTWIEGNVTKCGRSMFIFDEVDKLPSLLLDVIKPYVDYYDQLRGVSYRKAIFVFLSNEGGSDISRIAMQHWRDGKKREDLKLSDIENRVLLSAVNNERHSGLWHSQLITKHLITAYIPFLPLEKHHVRACIRDDMLQKYKMYKDEYIDEVMEELTFIPEVEQVFSATGCKRVSEKVDYVMIDKDIGWPRKMHINHIEF